MYEIFPDSLPGCFPAEYRTFARLIPRNMTGTIINTAAIVAGSLLGTWIRARLSRKIIDTLFQAMGLVTIAIAIPMTTRSGNFPLVVIAIASGTIIGQWIDLDGAVKRLAARLQRRLAARDDASGNFARGLVTATMLFCVGSMAILGPIEEAAGNTPSLLYTKSIMDGVAATALAASFGVAILFSSIPVLLYQGAITLCAVAVAGVASEALVDNLSATGGILLVGLGITILKVKEVNIVNMLLALPIAAILTVSGLLD